MLNPAPEAFSPAERIIESVSGLIDGIPCDIRSPRVQNALHKVFTAIQRHPRDWRRLCRRVRVVVWHPTASEGTLGEWVVDPEDCARLRVETTSTPRLRRRQGTEEYLATGQIMLARTAARFPESKLVATLAHECGHAVTRARDFDVRERVSTEPEWSNEMCADMYAFRWGFERQIRQYAKSRRLSHHAVLPGETIWGDGGKAYRADRRFFLRRVPRHDEKEGRPGTPSGPDIGGGSPVSTQTRTRKPVRN